MFKLSIFRRPFLESSYGDYTRLHLIRDGVINLYNLSTFIDYGAKEKKRKYKYIIQICVNRLPHGVECVCFPLPMQIQQTTYDRFMQIYRSFHAVGILCTSFMHNVL